MSDNKPLISVLTIFLNAEKFIQEAIDSVFAQTYEHWELLLIDDGSTDGSTTIARHYAEQYPAKVHYLEHDGHQNRGMSATRNLGIRQAKGDYIAILDSDDVWVPNKLSQQVEILRTHPEAAMVYGRTMFWFSWTGKPEDAQRDFLSPLGVPPNSLIKPPNMLIHYLKNCPYPCSVLFRREIVNSIGGFEETFHGMYEDQVFFGKIFAQAPVFISGECWDRYRQHPDSCCSIAIRTGQFHPSDPNPTSLVFLTWLQAYLAEQRIDDPEVSNTLQKMLWPYRHPTLYSITKCGWNVLRHTKQLVKLAMRKILPLDTQDWLRLQ
jgi:glycosyltransferase involved in cell wall biosynthesis